MTIDKKISEFIGEPVFIEYKMMIGAVRCYSVFSHSPLSSFKKKLIENLLKNIYCDHEYTVIVSYLNSIPLNTQTTYQMWYHGTDTSL